MKETIKIPFGVYYQEQFSKPMRRKQDVVSFILGVVNVLLVGESDSDSNGTLYLKRNKMNFALWRENISRQSFRLM